MICITSQTYWAVLDLPIESAILELSFPMSLTQVFGLYLDENLLLLFLRKGNSSGFEVEG